MGTLQVWGLSWALVGQSPSSAHLALLGGSGRALGPALKVESVVGARAPPCLLEPPCPSGVWPGETVSLVLICQVPGLVRG